ncbi:MAG: S1C family serine protease [Anaerolineae bacterium]
MTHSRKLMIWLALGLLLLTAIACQATLTAPAAEIDTDALVRQVVATVEAQLPTPAPIPTTAAVPVQPASSVLQEKLIEVYREANPSVVHIFVFDGQQDFSIPLGSGSGFLIDAEGHIVTNNHVVAEGTRFEVVFADGTRGKAIPIGTDVDSDLAVIQVDSLPPGVEPIPLGDSSNLAVGQFVIAIGNPFGEAGSMSVGIISGLGRTLDSQRVLDSGGRYSLPQVIQTDAAINPGNSGGPLLNLDGEVIGVNSAILTRSGTNSGVGFSIPVNAVKRVAPALIANGKYVYPFMGISMATSLDLEQQKELGLTTTKGVYITDVTPDSPADEAGLIGNNGPGGDFIVAIDGQPVEDSADLISYLVFETEVGQEIKLSVLRNNEEVEIPLVLGARP